MSEQRKTAASQKPSDASQPGPNASLPAKARAYGRYCQGQSNTHVAGQKGTPFSQYVTAMAKLASETTSSPKTACAALSKQRVAGQKGTPFSQCVMAGAKLHRSLDVVEDCFEQADRLTMDARRIKAVIGC